MQGVPIYAPASSVLIEVIQGWYRGEPLMLFQFVPPQAGAYQGDQYWYVAEQISPTPRANGPGRRPRLSPPPSP